MYRTIMYMKLPLHLIYLIFQLLYKHYSLKGIVWFFILTDGAASQPQCVSCKLHSGAVAGLQQVTYAAPIRPNSSNKV
jgi:hypothetical protein